MTTQASNFRSIRSWDGSQDRAFEELCFQLRDPTPPSATLWKLGDPDGGYEWFVRHGNGVEWGWQAKYSFDIDTLLKLMERSLKTVVAKRPGCRRLTFCIPFDLPDAPGTGQLKSARQKYVDRQASWRRRIPGAERIAIHLWSEGDLVERLSKPERRGTSWFFWDQEVFGPNWCRTRLEVTTQAAGKRYTPSLNVELPVAFALEGLGRSPEFVRRYRRRRGAVLKAARRVVGNRHTGLGVTTQMDALKPALRDCDQALVVGAIDESFPAATMRSTLDDWLRLVWDAYPDRDDDAAQSVRDRAGYLRHDLGQLVSRLRDLEDFLCTPAALAAERGVLMMTGGAGQGKTHLFCDAGQRALDTDRPGVVLLGQQFTGTRVFTDLAERIGVPARGASELLGAMRAAAEAAGVPFILLIDALNESGDPRGWRDEIPALLAEVAQYAPWVAVGISIRSSYLDLIASDATGSLPTVAHPGFDGYEYEAAQRFFESFGLEQPRVPLLLPEFTNPLFLRLYCEALASTGAAAPEVGHAHIVEVFDRYLATKNEQLSSALALDPGANIVTAAVAAFADAVAATHEEWLPREDARAVIDAHALHLHAWPDTLFGRLLSEGVLADDVAYRRSGDDWELVPSVRFAFQRFADYRVAASLLAPFATRDDLEMALRARRPLRNKLLNARVGLIEALAVLVPERFGVELLDAARWNLKDAGARRWYHATLSSIVARRDDAVSERTGELLRNASGKSQKLFEQATETLITVAARPGHPLNGEFLHAALSRWSMPRRDATWGITTYGWMDRRGPLDRLMRWAAAGPYPTYPDSVIELAAIPLVWTLSSPNRQMRDYATKVLCRLLAPRLLIMERLLLRFRSVNDPYVLQRLTVIAHGSVLVGGSADDVTALTIARLLAEIASDPTTVPDILVRDAARGAMEWCLRAELVETVEYEESNPPYRSEPPQRPRTQKQLEKAYERRRTDRDSPGYGALFSSIFSYGDFGRYVIESKVRHFTRCPLDAPLPPKRRARQPKPDLAKLAEFEQTLTAAQQELAAANTWDALMESLSFEQRRQLQSALSPRPIQPPSRTYSPEIAQRWVFERALTLGWTPELFADFDSNYRSYSRAGRSGHKPERFGKKYQWIALRELAARIADNFHMEDEWGEKPVTYQGPWQFYGRDIDPTLPPAPRLRDEDGVENLGATYPCDAATAWWIPDGPNYSGDDPPEQAGWATGPDDIPNMESLVRRTSPDQTEWVVLQAYYNWDEQIADGQEREDRPQRDMWSHIYSWIVRRSEARTLFDFLGSRSLMNRWMPQGLEITDDAYVPEMPWAAAAHEYPPSWETVEPRDNTEEPGVQVYAAWEQYFWEGNAWDCSIDDGVSMMVPSKELFDAGGLGWVPGTREWIDATGKVAVQYVESAGDRRSALLVRGDWLASVLEDRDWSLVIGWLGEKQLFGAGDHTDLLGGWSEINGVATLDRSDWTFGDRRIEIRQPVR